MRWGVRQCGSKVEGKWQGGGSSRQAVRAHGRGSGGRKAQRARVGGEVGRVVVPGSAARARVGRCGYTPLQLRRLQQQKA